MEKSGPSAGRRIRGRTSFGRQRRPPVNDGSQPPSPGSARCSRGRAEEVSRGPRVPASSAPVRWRRCGFGPRQLALAVAWSRGRGRCLPASPWYEELWAGLRQRLRAPPPPAYSGSREEPLASRRTSTTRTRTRRQGRGGLRSSRRQGPEGRARVSPALGASRQIHTESEKLEECLQICACVNKILMESERLCPGQPSAWRPAALGSPQHPAAAG